MGSALVLGFWFSCILLLLYSFAPVCCCCCFMFFCFQFSVLVGWGGRWGGAPRRCISPASPGVLKTHHQTSTASFETTRLELLRPGVSGSRLVWSCGGFLVWVLRRSLLREPRKNDNNDNTFIDSAQKKKISMMLQ